MKALRILILTGRIVIMAKNTMNIAKGVGAGLVAGLMFGFVSSVMMKDSRRNKKKAAKARQEA